MRSDAPFANILKLNYDSFRRWGRLYEVELLALDKVTRPSSFSDDVAMGIRMFLKGKINPLPTVGDRAADEAHGAGRRPHHARQAGRRAGDGPARRHGARASSVAPGGAA